jgi:hypothetical protein
LFSKKAAKKSAAAQKNKTSDKETCQEIEVS